MQKRVAQKSWYTEFGDFPIFGVRSLISAQQRGQEESKTPIFCATAAPVFPPKTAAEVSSAFVTHKSGICKQDKGKGEILLLGEKNRFWDRDSCGKRRTAGGRRKSYIWKGNNLFFEPRNSAFPCRKIRRRKKNKSPLETSNCVLPPRYAKKRRGKKVSL